MDERKEMTVDDLIKKLQALPEEMRARTAYTIDTFNGIPGVSPVTRVCIVHNREESGSWYHDDDEYPRVEIT